MVCATSAMAKEVEVVNISKIAGMPWFNRMGEGVTNAGKDLGINAYQVGPSSTDAPQQVKIIEDLIAKKVSAITIVPNDANVLEPVFKKARDQGIVVLTNESPGQPSANWDVEIIDNEKFAANNVEEMAKAMGGKGGYVIYVGGLTVPQHNLWADLFVKYQKEHYPEMHEVTTRMPVAENIDDARRTTLDLMKAHADLKGVISFGSQGPIGAGRAVKEKRARGKVFVFGMMIPSQAASLIKSGDITMGVTYDPATAGYALTAVADKVIKGEEIKQGLDIPKLGKADVDTDKRIIKFHNVLRVTKDNIDSLY
ncbi:autoinducer 2 ABC transporter substrate-binding protein [Atlantibacter hermannii]|uniref:autoinducer 2 ABC transporter substrate-binding protein n=1 Tax=Atlantibacter hermannii TaxID=565 RepID=UPI003F768863